MTSPTAAPGLDLGPIARSGPLRVRVKDALIELIINQRLAPGTHLVETEIADLLQVSRQPVREALQALQVDGWVDILPGRGAFVHVPTEDEVNEVFEARIFLETESASRAARNANDENVAELREICSQGRQAVLDGDVDTVVERNATLHRRISELSGNRFLTEFLASLDRRVRWYFTPLAAARGLSSWDEHNELIDAFAAGDSQKASDVMRRHTHRSQEVYQTRR